MSARMARYLLRFDDLCPTMDRARWERFLPLLARYGIQPILAVVPDNRDPELEREPEFAGFWDEMRMLEAAGAAIGLHGYQHVCEAMERSLIPLHGKTEFAGAPMEIQREWIRAGLAILRGQRLRPQIWVAPRHGFDAATLEILRGEGMDVISDGFARGPFRDYGVVWIPQQLWGPVEKRTGLWTICIHANSATDEAVAELETFLARFAGQFTSVERVLREWEIGERPLADRGFHAWMLTRIRLSRLWRRLQR